MEFLLGLISLLITAATFLGIPYMVYGNWKQALKSLKWQFEGDATLGILYIMIGLLFASLIFGTLCAFNNSIWHIDYWTTEGLWNK